MKTRNSFLLLLSLSIGNVFAQTDLKSYGFKGMVKSVTYRIYKDYGTDEKGRFDPEKSSLYIDKTMYFDKQGNMDSVVETLSEGRFFEKFITYYHHIGVRLKSSIKYRYYTNDVIEEMKYVWSEYNTKCSFKGSGLTQLTQGYRILLYTGRDSKGYYKQETKRGITVLEEWYKNEFDDNATLVRTTYSNAEKGDYSIRYEYDEIDDMGNPTQVKLIYEDTKKLQRFILKEFQYF